MSAILDALKRSEQEKADKLYYYQKSSFSRQEPAEHRPSALFLWVIAGLSCVVCILLYAVFMKKNDYVASSAAKSSLRGEQPTASVSQDEKKMSLSSIGSKQKVIVVQQHDAAAQPIQDQDNDAALQYQAVPSVSAFMATPVQQVKVIGIKDGCVVESRIDGKIVQIMMAGIVCPGKEHPIYNRVKMATAEKLFMNDVTLSVKKKYSYAFWSADVFSLSGSLFSANLVRQGMAWAADSRFQPLEAQAKKEKLGIWAAAVNDEL